MVNPPNNYDGVAQIPLDVPFTGETTAKQIVEASNVNLTNKVIIITGGHAGLGLEVTRALAPTNATIILGARRVEVAQKAVQDLIAAGAKIEIEQLDLAERISVTAFADKFLASNRPLDILINNAGISSLALDHLSRDAYGNEYMLSANHLGHFLLTSLLFPALKRATGVSRVVNTSSMSARLANVPQLLEDPNFEKNEFNGMLSYAQSKAAQVLFTVELDARAQAANIPLHVYSLHPGLIMETQIARGISNDVLEGINQIVQFRDENGVMQYEPNVKGVKSIEQGASSIVFAAIFPQLNEVTGGVFIDNNNIVGLAPPDLSPFDVTNHGIRKELLVQQSAVQLWDLTEKLTQNEFRVE